MSLKKAASGLQPKSGKSQFTKAGDAGYDNERENIDPHLKTKTVSMGHNINCKHIVPVHDGTGVKGGYVYGYRAFSSDDTMETKRMYWGNINFIDVIVMFGGANEAGDADVISDTGTVTTGGVNGLTDSSKSWVAGAYTGLTCRKRNFWGKDDSAIQEEYREITGNTTDTVVVNPNWSKATEAGDLYDIATVGRRYIQFGVGLRPTNLRITGEVYPTTTETYDLGKSDRVWENIHLVESRYYEGANYVGFTAPTLTADQIWVLPDADGTIKQVLVTDGAGNLSWDENASEKFWSFSSPLGNTGTFYYGGFYIFGGAANTFTPIAIPLGTANSSYAAHAFLLLAANTTDTVTIRISGTSVTDAGVRAAPDTEDIVFTHPSLTNLYKETTKKWLGTITFLLISGTATNCNYGLCKYWDNNNSDFEIKGVESTWLGGGNDAGANILLRHHKATGWTSNLFGVPTPPAAIADMNTDHVTEIRVWTDEHGAWKRDNLSTTVNGSGEEGTIVEIVTSANRTFENGTFILRITPA